MNQEYFRSSSFTFNSPEPSYSEEVNTSKGNHRIFNYQQQRVCWNQARVVIGRHPDRWRHDAAGNPVLRALHGCSGVFCYQYDHIIPFSKGGKTIPQNCQILQSKANLRKSNKTDLTMEELKSKSLVPRTYTERDMDYLEEVVYGEVLRPTLQDIYGMMLSKEVK